MLPDATILSLRNELTSDYVRRVLEAMWAAKRAHGAVRLRFRLDNETAGAPPDYRIEALRDASTGNAVIVDARRGSSDRSLGGKAVETASWSETTSTLEEVAQVLGELRNFRPRSVEVPSAPKGHRNRR